LLGPGESEEIPVPSEKMEGARLRENVRTYSTDLEANRFGRVSEQPKFIGIRTPCKKEFMVTPATKPAQDLPEKDFG